LAQTRDVQHVEGGTRGGMENKADQSTHDDLLLGAECRLWLQRPQEREQLIANAQRTLDARVLDLGTSGSRWALLHDQAKRARPVHWRQELAQLLEHAAALQAFVERLQFRIPRLVIVELDLVVLELKRRLRGRRRRLRAGKRDRQGGARGDPPC